MTPSPASRKTDRDDLARRRAKLLDESLLASQAKFEAGKLEEALEACQQALAFDEAHSGALELEERILVALGIVEAPTMLPTPAADVLRRADIRTAPIASGAAAGVVLPPSPYPRLRRLHGRPVRRCRRRCRRPCRNRCCRNCLPPPMSTAVVTCPPRRCGFRPA